MCIYSTVFPPGLQNVRLSFYVSSINDDTICGWTIINLSLY